MPNYDKAITLLKALPTQYPDPRFHAVELKHQALAIIRNCNDEKITEQFRNLTTFNFGTLDEVKHEKILKAIRVAITAFETKNITETSTPETAVDVRPAIQILQDTDAKKRAVYPKIFTYLFFYLVLTFALIGWNNFSLLSQIKITLIQALILLAAPLLFMLNTYINKIPERWFAIALGIVMVVLDKILS